MSVFENVVVARREFKPSQEAARSAMNDLRVAVDCGDFTLHAPRAALLWGLEHDPTPTAIRAASDVTSALRGLMFCGDEEALRRIALMRQAALDAGETYFAKSDVEFVGDRLRACTAGYR